MYLEVVDPITFETALELSNRGHYVIPYKSITGRVGGYSLIVIDPETGTFFGAGGPRRQNYAVGY